MNPHPSLGPAKRLLDVLVAASAVVLLSPVFVIVAAAVKLSSPGPALYRRTIPGLHARTFQVLKFRSMVQNAHQQMQTDPILAAEYANNLKIRNDPRITTTGRFLRKCSLDELPQLFNVLKGEMSLVGPRMLGDIELAKYGDFRDKVLSVRPGITGAWQISGRHRTSFDDRLRLDMDYIDRWSLARDVMILAKTPLAVINMTGAS